MVGGAMVGGATAKGVAMVGGATAKGLERL